MSEQTDFVRRRIRDLTDPPYFTDEDLEDFIREENGSPLQGAARALEVWAASIPYEEGVFSAQGVGVNSGQMAAAKLQLAQAFRAQHLIAW